MVGEETTSSSERPITVKEVEPLVKDFASRWKGTIEVMHKDIITIFFVVWRSWKLLSYSCCYTTQDFQTA